MLLGKDRFSEVDIRIRVKGGGRVSQIYAIRQALSKALVAYYQKCKFSQINYWPIPLKLSIQHSFFGTCDAMRCIFEKVAQCTLVTHKKKSFLKIAE